MFNCKWKIPLLNKNSTIMALEMRRCNLRSTRHKRIEKTSLMGFITCLSFLIVMWNKYDSCLDLNSNCVHSNVCCKFILNIFHVSWLYHIVDNVWIYFQNWWNNSLNRNDIRFSFMYIWRQNSFTATNY